MSITDRVADEKKYKDRKKTLRGSNGTTNNFLSFNPTKEQKQAIRNSGLTLADNLDYLSTWLMAGNKISWQYSKEQEAWAVFFRQGDVDWREALVLSCWHVDYEIAIGMLAYALNNVFSSWPVVADHQKLNDVDW